MSGYQLFVIVFCIVPLILMIARKYYLLPKNIIREGGALDLVFSYGLGVMILIWGFVAFYRRYLA